MQQKIPTKQPKLTASKTDLYKEKHLRSTSETFLKKGKKEEENSCIEKNINHYADVEKTF